MRSLIMCVATACIVLAGAVTATAQSPRLEVLTPTGATRDGLQVLAPHPSPADTRSVLERGFSARLLRLYALEQKFLQQKKGIAPEPAYLLWSDRQGGFPQFGFYLGDVKKDGVGWVDLHRESRLSGRFGAPDQIFPHELLHVIVRQLAGEPKESGGNQVHAIGVRTDPVNALTEGIAEAMQVLAVDDPDAVPETKALPGNASLLAAADRNLSAYSRSLERRWWPIQSPRVRFLLWFNQTEQALRYHGVRANRFARGSAAVDALIDRGALDAAYLVSSVVPGDADGAVKPAAVMLSSEGVIAHLFWRFLTDPALQRADPGAGFHASFGVSAADVSPLDNVFLKLFAALYESRASTGADLLRAYARMFPAEAADVDRVVHAALLGQSLPSAPELWLLNDGLMTGTSLFDQYRALPRPHTFDANAATRLDWMSVPGVSRADAETLLAGVPYATYDAVVAAAPATLRPRIATMSAAMSALLSHAADEEETLSLTTILLSYVWRLLGVLVVAAAAGTWLARRAGARRNWTAALLALAAGLIVMAFAWVITCPAWYPFAAPLVIGAGPWLLWRIVRRRTAADVAATLWIWAAAAAPMWLATRL